MLTVLGWSLWTPSTWLALLIVAEWCIRIVMVPIVLRRRFHSSTALAWLTMIFFLPEVGLVLYLLIGENRLGRRRIRRHRRWVSTLRSEDWQSHQRRFAAAPPLDATQRPMMLQAEQATGLPIVTGNSVELTHDNADMIERLMVDIEAATHHVHLLFYIYEDDQTGRRVAEALYRAVDRGVTCRLLADAVGSRPFCRSGYLSDEMRQRGVQVVANLPAAPLRRRLARIDLRNHRKLAVIDGKIAYAGSQNIHDTSGGSGWEGKWVDMTGRFRGPIVQQLQTVFVEDWSSETNEEIASDDLFPTPDIVGEVAAQAVPTGPSHQSQNFDRILLTALNAAQRKVIITTPYLVPDEATLLSLAMAADRGVDVNLVIPVRTDLRIVSAAARSYYDYLLESGVKLHHHDKGLLHAKTMTVDDAFALLGSANIDIRSFELNFELSVLLYGEEVTRQLRFAQMQLVAESKQLDLETWRKRPKLQQYVDAAAALMSPLL